MNWYFIVFVTYRYIEKRGPTSNVLSNFEISKNVEHNIGIHSQALINHFEPITNRKNPIINPVDPKTKQRNA